MNLESKNENSEIDISEYYQTPLSSLILPENYAKLIKRIMGINGFNNSLGEKFIIENVEDILKLEPDEFARCQGIGKLYINTLIEFKKELPCLLNKINKQSHFTFEDDIFISINNYNLETPIYQLTLSPKYQKLIKRISAVINNIETVQDIIDIDVASFSKLPAIGKLYIELLTNLQNTFSPNPINQKSNEHIVELELPSEAILSKLFINYGFLNDAEIKQLKKLENFYGESVDIRNVNILLNIDKFSLAKQAGFGALFSTSLNNLQEKIKIELSVLPENITEYTVKQRGLFVSSEITFIDFCEIDNILIEDIEGY